VLGKCVHDCKGDTVLVFDARLVSGAVIIAWGCACQNPSELSFQLQGRLLARRLEIAEVHTIVASGEKYEDRPRPRSSDPLLHSLQAP
jgi:hypothetical protein